MLIFVSDRAFLGFAVAFCAPSLIFVSVLVSGVDSSAVCISTGLAADSPIAASRVAFSGILQPELPQVLDSINQCPLFNAFSSFQKAMLPYKPFTH